MASIVIKSLDNKIIESPSDGYAIGDTVELNNIDGQNYVFKVLDRKWFDGLRLVFYFDFALRLRGFHDLEGYLFSSNADANQILSQLSDRATEMLYTGLFPSMDECMSDSQRDLFRELDMIAMRSGKACHDKILEVCSRLI